MSISLTRNIGVVDSTIRGCLGFVLAVFGALIVKGTIGMVLVILSVPLLFTAIIGFCVGYVPSCISTRRDSTCWRSRETKEKDEKVVSAGIEVLWLLPRGIYD